MRRTSKGEKPGVYVLPPRSFRSRPCSRLRSSRAEWCSWGAHNLDGESGKFAHVLTTAALADMPTSVWYGCRGVRGPLRAMQSKKSTHTHHGRAFDHPHVDGQEDKAVNVPSWLRGAASGNNIQCVNAGRLHTCVHGACPHQAPTTFDLPNHAESDDHEAAHATPSHALLPYPTPTTHPTPPTNRLRPPPRSMLLGRPSSGQRNPTNRALLLRALLLLLLAPAARAFCMLSGPLRVPHLGAAAAAAATRRLPVLFRARPFSPRACAAAMSSVADNLATIRLRVEAAAKAAGFDPPPRLVAVSKTKPAEALQEAYDAGQRHFGENYVHEVLEKAPLLPKDIQWHFIGHLQSNKAKPMVGQVPNLWMVEAVDSAKLADKLQAAAAAVLETERKGQPLKVLVQVDTSGEDTKSGVTTEEALEIAQHILAHCPALSFAGIMTIGAPGDMSCFDKLVEARQTLASTLGLDARTLELSMGMSGDFEEAIARGSTNVRVGSSIFGERQYPAAKKAAASPPPAPQEDAGGEERKV